MDIATKIITNSISIEAGWRYQASRYLTACMHVIVTKIITNSVSIEAGWRYQASITLSLHACQLYNKTATAGPSYTKGRVIW